MILFFENGRLGNQLFQYYGFKLYFPYEKLVFFGCDDFNHTFERTSASFVSKRAIGRWLPFGLFKRFIFFLAYCRILGQILEVNQISSLDLVIRKGIIWNIFVPQNVYFQHSDVIDRLKTNPTLNSQLIHGAQDWMRAKGINGKSSTLIFVHIRRGDYLHWPSKDSPAVLDASWYIRAMKVMHETFKNPVFILMSDDPYYLHDIFTENETLIISENSSEIDFAIMTMCHSGILSSSSFAWWGAFLARSQGLDNARFIAPEFWCGHRSMKWYPAGFRTNWLTYL